MALPGLDCIRTAALCAAVAAACGARAAEVADFPSRPVRMVVPFSAGGGTDIIARLIAAKLAEKWQQAVIVDNRPGGGSVIGSDLVARASPDGHTLLLTANPHSSNPALHPKLPYDTVRDFAAVTQVASAPLLLASHPALALGTVKELIALARVKPGSLSYGSSGNGGPQHIAGELFKSMAAVDIVHVPYKGSAPATTALLGGQVQLGFTSLLAVLPHVKAGKLRALATTGASRSPALPEIPTIAESGLPGYATTTWYGVFTTGGTPRGVVEALNRAVVEALRAAEVRERLARDGSVIVADSPQAFHRFIVAEIEQVRRLARQSGMKIE
ncbi:MAG: tripartite tricarboxylate transporter substrate binding protein [Burkholderiales bacterium]|nr:tripartite tricarboxylate transporter substrate binding protein [Burkholderiales bacterium]